MAERTGPQIYSIAAHRGFADALVAGLVPRHAEPDFGLARLTLLLPSRRAIRTLSEAFIRHFGTLDGAAGLLMPRMAVIGDLDLDETLGPLLDPLGAGPEIPPAVDPTRRWLRLAQLIQLEQGSDAPRGGALLRMASELASGMDRLLVEEIGPEELMQERVLDLLGDLAGQWQHGIRLFARVQARWLAELAERGEVDAAARRNLLFRQAARKWRQSPPTTPIVAAGVTSAAPALAQLLRVVSELPRSAVVLPDLDLDMVDAVWAELGCAGAPAEPDGAPIARGDAVTHPQYHLKLLLNRMGVGRGEVQPWHRSGASAARPERSRAISNLFLPPEASKAWAELPAEDRRLSGVRIMESANPEEEAQAIALLIREGLEQPEKRIALVTPDRGLAARVTSHLRRWNIAADDTAGVPLSQTAAGRVLLLLAQCVSERAAPVPLMALLEHPLVAAGAGRAQWLDHARALELELRGPRPAPDPEALRERAELAEKRSRGAAEWWRGVEEVLSPLLSAMPEIELPLAEQLGALIAAGEALCGEALWAREDGRALSAMLEDLRLHASDVGTRLTGQDLHAVLSDRMDMVAVRPPWGGHPRIAIYGLLESRMTRADLVICGGLNEGTWPPVPPQDPLLAPAVLRALGVPGADFRIGLAAHDLAGALGAPQVVLSRAERDVSGPAIPSRFLLRVKALLGGDLLSRHRDDAAVVLARNLDDAAPSPPYRRPEPMPNAEQRKVDVSVTALDRLRSDPYQFYASAILGLRTLDPLDAPPSPAWQGIAAHEILEVWHKEGGQLHQIAERVLDQRNAHPLMRKLWRPRLLAALDWIEAEIARMPERTVLSVEAWGTMEVMGVKIRGRADRIDSLPGGELAIVDYKTGTPPTGARVQEGFALQLGVVGLMARAGAFEGVAGEPTRFEYWSFGRSDRSETGFGYRSEPVKEGQKRSGIPRDEFLAKTDEYLRDALAQWIVGEQPFTARLNPNLPSYDDYDQLMRLDEWMGREEPTS